MPSSLLQASIRGVRSYSPLEDSDQTIDFMPLTLIVGQNGTGKTTVIEALKFIISGEEPPHSDSRRNFVHTQKVAEGKKLSNKSLSYAAIEIKFRNSFGEICAAKREITRPGASGKNSTPSISSSYQIGKNGSWVSVHKQDDWNKIMPKLFGLPNQAILSNVLLCHQEDNLWCMGDSASVKQIFDKIFGCEQYKREIKFIDEEIRSLRKELELSKKDMVHFGEAVERKKELVDKVASCEEELLQMAPESFDAQISELSASERELSVKLREREVQKQHLAELKRRVQESYRQDKMLKNSLQQILDMMSYEPPPPPPAKRRPIAPPLQPPPPPQPSPPPVDEVAQELACTIDNLKRVHEIVARLPQSKELDEVIRLVDLILNQTEKIRAKFVVASAPPQLAAQPEQLVVDLGDDDDDDDEEEQKRQEEERKRHEAERIEKQKRYRDSTEASIQENLKKLEELKEKVVAYERQADDDCEVEQLEEKIAQVKQELVELRHKRSVMIGSKMQLERVLKRNKAELESYSQANKKYAESLGAFKCSQLVLEDLEKLKKCFQQSITTFHDTMIVKINKVLRARWQQIYQGSDIDFIELVDEEITRGNDRKSHNYHVAMQKSGLRMRMREKSSAGQRALAAIILRMTLAELFVKDFAFMALDEPTANLDLASVQSLAKAIGAHVRRRAKKGANIQWIIITHDEQFLRALNEECSPFYYRVQLDQNGFSTILKVPYQDSVELSSLSGMESSQCD